MQRIILVTLFSVFTFFNAAHVEYVIDGDTIIVRNPVDNTKEKIRIARLACPELTGKYSRAGHRARIYLAKKISGKNVFLARDPFQPDRDKYGRLLRFVYFKGVSVGEELINKGYCREFKLHFAKKRKSRKR